MGSFRRAAGRVIMLFAFTPQDLERLAGPIGILVGIIAILAQPQLRSWLFKGQPPSYQSKFPVSTACPNCGGTAYAATAPETPLAFVSDRTCKACGTRYTPPTPKWGAVLFVLLGLCLLGFAIYSAITNTMSVIYPGVFARVVEGVIGFAAIGLMEFGIKAFREAT